MDIAGGEPLTEALRRYTMATSKLHGDDTRIPVLAPGNKSRRPDDSWCTCATTAVRVRRSRPRCGSTAGLALH
ncbi:transposase [Caballeronia sp. ATUFL_M2_KS44]|uniref:IS66 family transposase n=1 Tax=Caballeronia sp. ATUFL_M2_KS44 TaxID=2921767 RepID=UPI0032EC2AF4